MKSIKNARVVAILAGVLVLACAGFSLGGQAPSAFSTSISQLNGAGAPVAASTPILANPQPPADVAGLQSAFEMVYQDVNPSVVTIEIGTAASNLNGSAPGFGQGGNGQNGQNGQGQQIVPTALGSGVIWDDSGHIVTNNHVVEGAAKLTVTFADGSSYDAKVVGTDPNTDLAVIQVTGAPASLLKPVTIGNSTKVQVGEMVVAIGNPFGLSNTMTTGIVSAIGRSIQAGNPNSQNGQTNAPTFSIPDVIQTDAAINPGNSGGALVDMGGALIGVPSQIESQSGSNSGIGFAIPSAIAVQVAQQLISKGVATHSYLGISGTTVTADVISALNLQAGQHGVLVATVVPGGPAEKAGLQPAPVDANGNPTGAGDIIVGIDGQQVTSFEDLVSYLYANTQPGQSVTLNVLRNGKQIQVPVTLGSQPSQ